ncbi:hypothetical protein PGB90_006906 [Kerria lacca]
MERTWMKVMIPPISQENFLYCVQVSNSQENARHGTQVTLFNRLQHSPLSDTHIGENSNKNFFDKRGVNSNPSHTNTTPALFGKLFVESTIHEAIWLN